MMHNRDVQLSFTWLSISETGHSCHPLVDLNIAADLLLSFIQEETIY